MKIHPLLCIPFYMPLFAQAATVIFTDVAHPPGPVSPEVKVVYLDAPRQLEMQHFGVLPANTHEAVVIASTRMNSPDFHQWEKQLAETWQGVAAASQLGVKKIPAVVFDEREVVYGTTDVVRATALRIQWKASGGGR